MKVEAPYQQTEEDITQTKWNAIRESRAIFLREADNLVAIALDKSEDPAPYRKYRQALRDIPQTYSNPDDVVWPDKPAT